MRMLRSLLAVVAAIALLAPVPAGAGMRTPLEEQLRILASGERPPLLIEGARYRLAVCTYADPRKTGLGDAIADLMSHDLLLNTPVRSLGVLTFTAWLGPTADDRLSYFDKVERVTGAQEATLAVWGKVQPSGQGLAVDTFVQVLPRYVKERFSWRVPLAGGETLVAHLRPDRIPIQRLRLGEGAQKDLERAARQRSELRSEPDARAGVRGLLPQDKLFYVIDREGDWVELGLDGGLSGWVPLREHCTGDCRQLLDAATFTSGLVRYMADRGAAPVAGESLTPEARAVADQIRALDALVGGRPTEARAIAERWLQADAQGASGVPPGGAAFANIRAMARAAALAGPGGPGLDPTEARSIAFELAESSQYDPRNRDVLHNLAVLFTRAGETDRAQLAATLAERPAP